MRTPRNKKEFEDLFGTFEWRDLQNGSILIDRKWRSENIHMVELPWTNPNTKKPIIVWVHHKLVDVLERTADEAAKVPYLVTRVDSFVPRHRNWRPTGPLSVHSWGAAVDINPLVNMVGTAGDMPPEFVAAWERNGWCWGGRWRRPKDPMHFQYWKE